MGNVEYETKGKASYSVVKIKKMAKSCLEFAMSTICPSCLLGSSAVVLRLVHGTQNQGCGEPSRWREKESMLSSNSVVWQLGHLISHLYILQESI